MKLYSAKIRLAGNAYNEVLKHDLTAAEIILLSKIHEGGEHSAAPVVDIKLTGEVKRSDAEERQRLIGTDGEVPALYDAALYRKVFTSDFTPLPQEISAELVTGVVVSQEMAPDDIQKEIDRLEALRQKQLDAAAVGRAAMKVKRQAAKAEEAAADVME